MEKYYKNFILCGEVTYYCVLCHEIFYNIHVVEKHMKWDTHRNNVKNKEYVAKFRKNFIYKVTADRFYCEICNLVFKKVQDHLNESSHQDLKKSKSFAKPRKSNLQFIEKFAIKISNEKLTVAQWQGLIDDMCLLCNEPFGIVISHIKSFNHIVNLIQSETISENGNHYRKQDTNIFYCFGCFKVYNKDNLDVHWTECHENVHKLREEKANKKNMKKVFKTSQTDLFDANESKRTENKYFNFGMENKAIYIKCRKEVDLIDPVIYEKRQNLDLERPLIDKGKRRAELAKYGRNNFITLNEGGSKSYCILCCVYMSAHIKNAKEHVQGSLHRGHLELRGMIQVQKHGVSPFHIVPHRNYIKFFQGPYTNNGVSVVCINKEICVTLLSYKLISVNYNFINDLLKCYGCNILINTSDLNVHANSEEHKIHISRCKVLIFSEQYTDEYIREVHPNLYHCGYCNSVVPFWENLKKHLKSAYHLDMRIKAGDLLISLLTAKNV